MSPAAVVSPPMNMDTERAVANIFNAAVAAPSIGAAWEVGLFDALQDSKSGGKLHIPSFAAAKDLDVGAVQAVATSLAVADVVERLDRDTITGGRLLADAHHASSLFHWLCLGSGGLFSEMQYVLRNKHREGKGESFYRRDPAAIGYACREINKKHFDPAFWKAMGALDYAFRKAVDLGSGSGERLMQILGQYPGTTALGIDIAAPSLKIAAQEAVARGFGGRIAFTEGDARELSPRKEFEGVDLLTCFMMGHDFWPRENCVATLRRLRASFPDVKRFLLGDTVRILMDSPEGEHAVSEVDDVPIFTLAFEAGHALMGVYVPTLEDWRGVFAEGGWRCNKEHLIKTQSLSVIFELEPADSN